MPGGDGMGPWGFGPCSGRGRGFCFGNAAPVNLQANRPYSGQFWGRGGFGRGGSCRNGWINGRSFAGYMAPAPVPLSPVQEIELLKAQKQYLEKQQAGFKNDLDALEKHIQELEKNKE